MASRLKSFKVVYKNKLLDYRVGEKLNLWKKNLRVVLSARAIGGFLDESLNNNPDYKFADSFKKWVLGI